VPAEFEGGDGGIENREFAELGLGVGEAVVVFGLFYFPDGGENDNVCSVYEEEYWHE